MRDGLVLPLPHRDRASTALRRRRERVPRLLVLARRAVRAQRAGSTTRTRSWTGCVGSRNDLGLLAEQVDPADRSAGRQHPAGALAPGARARGRRDRACARRGVVGRQRERRTQLARLSPAEPGRSGLSARPASTYRVHGEHGGDRADRRADPIRDHVARIHRAIRKEESLPELGDDADRRAERSGRDDRGARPATDRPPSAQSTPERDEQRRVGGELDERVARPRRDAESPEEVEHRVEAEEAAVAVDVHRPEQHDRERRGVERSSRRAAAARWDWSSRMPQRPRRLHCTERPRDRMESSGSG